MYYSISTYSMRGNYSFLDLEIQRSQYINVRKLYEEIRYISPLKVQNLYRQFQAKELVNGMVLGRASEGADSSFGK
jgi:hypothetical protein